MPIKIPQNVDKEDQLVGPLTLKQFLYLLGGGALAFVAYQYYVQGYLFFAEFVIIGLLALSLAAALAFAKINGRPFVTFLMTAFMYVGASKRRLWHRQNIAPTKVKVGNRHKSNQPPTRSEDDVSKGRLEKLAHILDTGGRIDTESATDSYEINTLPRKEAATRSIENQLGVEDVLAETDI